MKNKVTIGVVALAALAIAFVGGRIIGGAISSSKEEITLDSVVIENAGDVTMENEETTEKVDEIFDATFFGAIYENDTLTYGPICLQLPGYSLEEKEEENNDYLISSDQENRIWVNKNIEISATYDIIDEAGIVELYESNESYSEVTLISFEKTMLGQYPEIIYTVNLKSVEDENNYYLTEVILMDDMSATQSVRLYCQSASEEAYQVAVENLKNMKLNQTPVREEDSENTGIGMITEK